MTTQRLPSVLPPIFGLMAVLSGVVLCDAAQAADAQAPKPHTRRIPLDGQSNFRDLGGYETTDGRRVRWGEVFRSGELSNLSGDDVVCLHQLGVRTVASFLTEAETEVAGKDRLPYSAKSVALPLDSKTGLGSLARTIIEARRTGDFSLVPVELNPAIHRLLIREGREEYAALLRLIADPENRPFTFHCSHGVHRTGTAAAILLSALGVPWETIREDYLLSNAFRANEVALRLTQLQGLAATTAGIPMNEVDTTNMEAFYILEGAYIDAARDEAVKEYGSMENYIREGLGLSEDEILNLRVELLVPSPAGSVQTAAIRTPPVIPPAQESNDARRVLSVSERDGATVEAHRSASLSAPPEARSKERSRYTATTALAALAAGNTRFISGTPLHPHEKASYRSRLTEGQHPFATIVGCSDSRVPIELLFDQGLGDLFVIRVAGNVMGEDVVASIEYAVEHLHTPLVLVLGHEGCGAVTGALASPMEQAREAEELQSLFGKIKPALQKMDPALGPDELLHRSVEANVRWSIDQLHSVSRLEAELQRGDFEVVGAIYDLATGRVRILEP